MGSLTAAWLLGTGIVAYRQVSVSHKPPVPGALLGITALFLGFALISDAAPGARRTVALVAWGLDIAGLLNVWPKGLSGELSGANASETAAETAGSGGGTPAGTVQAL
jgi:hypothetical protein